MQQEMGITFVYITHDQEEALNMSTRIVILREGRVEQIGTPEEVYEHPQTLFAAGFIGQSNLLRGEVTSVRPEGRLTLRVEDVELPAIADRPLCRGRPGGAVPATPAGTLRLPAPAPDGIAGRNPAEILFRRDAAYADRPQRPADGQRRDAGFRNGSVPDRSTGCTWAGIRPTLPVVPDEKLDLEAAEGGKG